MLPLKLRFSGRVDIVLRPPSFFVTNIVKSSMVKVAERDNPLITDLEPERPWLCKSKMMRLGWCSPTDDTGECRDVFQMNLIPHAFRGWEGEDSFVDSDYRTFGPFLIDRDRCCGGTVPIGEIFQLLLEGQLQ